ncbi:hypothetical protein SLS58_011360 [Diplodia intermedia]|uniref:Ankyrin repeat protein n=1 Tax=Diplodia intermedia TaxID=856260 RepID=A0ABR3SZA4_9PEZI
MLDAGASDRDAYLLLEEAAKCDKLDTVRRILDSGVSLEHVPLCAGSPRMAQALVETGAALDREKLQTHAIRCSSLDLLKWLDETYGPSAPPERFGLVLRDASNAVLSMAAALKTLAHVTLYSQKFCGSLPEVPSWR